MEVYERNNLAVDSDPGTAGTQPETTSYDYDLLGNLDDMTTPDGVITDYVYDFLNRLDQQIAYLPDSTPGDLTDNDKLDEFDYTLRADGKRSQAIETFWFDSNSDSIAEPHTNQIDWTYDDAGRLIDEVFNHYDDLWDQTEHFTYDLTGNRVEKTLDKGNDSSIDETTTYTFDENDRMLAADTDTDGDQQADNTTTYGYTGTEQTSEQVTESGTLTSSVTYTYDLQGRMAVAEITTYTGANPSRVERTSYEYDPDGIRVSKLSEINANPDVDSIFESRTLSEYLIDANNHTGYQQVLQVTVTDADTDTELKKVIYTIGNDVIAQTTFESGGPTQGTTLVLHADGHGSTRVLTDLAAAIVEVSGVPQIFHYTAYGQMLGLQAASALTSLLYNGEQFDVSIGKQYLRARYYDAVTGTFNRLDPFFGNLQDPQSLHKYLYTRANPINEIDPTGLDGTLGSTLGGLSVGGILGGIVGGAVGGWKGALIGAIGGGLAGYFFGLAAAGATLGFSYGSLYLSHVLGSVTGLTTLLFLYLAQTESWDFEQTNRGKSVALVVGPGTEFAPHQFEGFKRAANAAGHHVEIYTDVNEAKLAQLIHDNYVTAIFAHGDNIGGVLSRGDSYYRDGSRVTALGLNGTSRGERTYLGDLETERTLAPEAITDHELAALTTTAKQNYLAVAGCKTGDNAALWNAAKTGHFVGTKGNYPLNAGIPAVLRYVQDLLNDGQAAAVKNLPEGFAVDPA